MEGLGIVLIGFGLMIAWAIGAYIAAVLSIELYERVFGFSEVMSWIVGFVGIAAYVMLTGLICMMI
jgi:hypothetical protein